MTDKLEISKTTIFVLIFSIIAFILVIVILQNKKHNEEVESLKLDFKLNQAKQNAMQLTKASPVTINNENIVNVSVPKNETVNNTISLNEVKITNLKHISKQLPRGYGKTIASILKCSKDSVYNVVAGKTKNESIKNEVLKLYELEQSKKLENNEKIKSFTV